MKKSLQLNNQKLNLKAVPKPILKNSSNYDQNQSFPGSMEIQKLESTISITIETEQNKDRWKALVRMLISDTDRQRQRKLFLT